MHLVHHSGIPLLGIYPKEMKVCIHTKTCMRMFKAILFIIAINWKLINGQIVLHLRNGIRNSENE